jgi:hypothetical protein
MSNSYDTTVSGGAGVTSMNSPSTSDTAKQEAAELKNTTTDQAKNVLGTAKDEASSVIGEAKWQAKDLYAQTQRELKDQANTQQQRLAGGLRSVSDDLNSLASGQPTSGGMATDLVRQVSSRLSSASSWIGDRDPGTLLQEVKQYARRKPGTFILLAAAAGVVAGRLTRALASNASDNASSGNGTATRTGMPVTTGVGTGTGIGTGTGMGTGTGTGMGTGAGIGTGLGAEAGATSGLASDEWAAPGSGTGAAAGMADTPIYEQSATDVRDLEDGDDRSNSV